MKCPECGYNDAFLCTQDGITQPGRNIEVEIRCEKCGGEAIDYAVGNVEIDLIIKRGTYVSDTPQR